MSTPAVTSSTAATTPGTTAAGKPAGLSADSNTFLKLMVANLQHQDPMSPQDSSQYVQQLSQMTMVEQVTQLAKTSAESVATQKRSDAVALLGRTVTYDDGTGAAKTGVVADVDLSGDAPALVVDGAKVAPGDVTGVK